MNFDLRAMGEKAKGFLKVAGEKTVKAASEIRARTDRAAEVVAAKVTEMTGRETTATEVKRAAAVVASAVVIGTGVLAVASARQGGAAGMLADSATGGGFGNSFEDQVAETFARGGHSLNFYAPHVDSCGTIYSGPNG